MRNVKWVVPALIFFAMTSTANADSRVATSFRGAPHVHNMTTPGECPEGYSPGIYNTIKQCIRCDYGATYYPTPYPAVCALCPASYTYDPQIAACFPKKP